MACDRCSETVVLYRSHTIRESVSGEREEVHLQLCAACAREETQAREAEVAGILSDVQRRIADGSLLAELRHEVAPILARGDPREMREVAAFLAQVATALPDGLPPDLLDLVRRYHVAGGEPD